MLAASSTREHPAAPMTLAAEQPLPLRLRRDLLFRQVQFGQRTFWNVKDPVTLRYFQLREEEYFILTALNGHATREEIRERFERRFAPLRLGASQFQTYLESLFAQGLVIRQATGQGDGLLRRHQQLLRRQRLDSLTGILAIRFRGVDPERWLRAVYPTCRWLFSWWSLTAMLAMVVAALVLVAVQFHVMLERLPDLPTFFQVRNLTWIALTIGAAKVLHELGHALTCKHFGGSCHELGVMLLVFTPCLYCNVSDAWMMNNKWHRIAISAAGIVVEVVLAALCTFLWWFSEPGLLNTICLNVMIVCSVNTLLFNGNPLLRYDGYYVLADLVEVPNLSQQAATLWKNTWATWCLGVRSPRERSLPTRARSLLLSYAIAAAVYRVTVMIAIFWFLHLALRPYGLSVLATSLAVLLVGTMVWRGGRNLTRYTRHTLKSGQLHKGRAALSLVIGLSLLGFGLWVPLPRSVVAPVVVEPLNAQRVFVTVRGRIPRAESDRPVVAAGDLVRQGDPLVHLENPALEDQVEQLRGELDTLRLRVTTLKLMRIQDQQAGDQLPAAEQALLHLESQLKHRQRQQSQLVLTAPIAGIVLPDQRLQSSSPSGELSYWSGTPLDAENVGCTLENGTTYCLIGDPTRLVGVAVVDQADIELVRAGQIARLWLRQLPGQRLDGVVSDISASPMEEVPSMLLPTGDLPLAHDEPGASQPASASFYVHVALPTPSSRIPLRSTGWVKIATEPESLARRIYRYLARTIRFF